MHQSVAPHSRAGAQDATVSVNDGTSETTRLTVGGTATGKSRSSVTRSWVVRPEVSPIPLPEPPDRH